MAYDYAINESPALELAELVDGELGPALVTAHFATDDNAGEAQNLLTICSRPLKTLTAFMTQAAQEDRTH